MSTDPRVAGRHALIAVLAALVLVAVLVRIDVSIPGIGQLGSALVAVLFLYVPVIAASRRGEDLDDYGFHAAPIGRGLAYAGLSLLVIFPLFVGGYFLFYEVACKSDLLAHLVPRHACTRYLGWDALHWPAPTWKLAEFCATQLLVVALPEELFFRGFVLELLERRFPPKRRLFGGGVGLALVLSALAFAIVHLPKDGDPRALATFFPGLLFGWMRSATRSILAGTFAHASSNILVHVLDLAAQR